MRRIHFTRQFNWRMLLVRILVNALALIIISILPDIYFKEPTILRILFVALILGVLNSFVKPIIQVLTLRFIFITYGFAIVIINAIILILLNIVVPNMFAVDSLLWAIIGGALLGLVAAFFENLMGLQIPILPEEESPRPELAADPTRVLSTKLASGFTGPEEELSAEVPVASEVQYATDDTETPQEGEK